MTDALLERIAVALERIADRMELVTSDPEPVPESTEVSCSHPVELRLALGATNGWVCQACQFTETPS